MQIFPNLTSVLVSRAGNLVKPWIQYFQQFTQAPPNAIKQNVGTFTAAEPGFLYVKGAATVHLVRGTLNLDCGGAVFVPVSIGDQVITTGSFVSYFFPIYGAATTS